MNLKDPVRKLEIDCPCQEAGPLSINRKIDCGAPAVGIVWHNKDQKAYPMCEPCMVHNVQNRGGILLVGSEGQKEEIVRFIENEADNCDKSSDLVMKKVASCFRLLSMKIKEEQA